MKSHRDRFYDYWLFLYNDFLQHGGEDGRHKDEEEQDSG
jgi:hypothetical protein